jgi:hypothetical protein
MDYEPPPPSPQGQRQTFLAVLLAVLMGAGFVFFLVIVTGGLLLEVLAAVGGIGLFGYVHYLLWGRSLSQQVAGERALEEDQPPTEAELGAFEEHPVRRPY